MNDNRLRFYDGDYALAFLNLKAQVENRCVVCQVALPDPPTSPEEAIFLEGLFQGNLVGSGLRANVVIKGDNIIAYPLFDG